MGYKIKLTICLLFVTLLTACGGSGLEEKIEESASPSISNSSAQTYSDNTAISTLSFSNSGGGLLTGCTADSLPSGLSVRVSSDRNTCEITGTPTRSQSIAAYTITASNAFGSDTAIARITVTTESPTFSAPTLANASTQTYIVNTAISVLRFTNSSDGSLTACTADSLPAGLSLAISVDGDSCEISGTPTEAQAATSHMITATNGSGSDTATVSITVDAETPALSMPSLVNALARTYIVGSEIAEWHFINSGGGALSDCSVDSLPEGLSVAISTDGNTCLISGTPTAIQSRATITVTASNATGSDLATASLSVRIASVGPFITTWKTDNPGSSNNDQIIIGTSGDGYDYSVDWGDGAVESNITGDVTHTYSSAGTYTVEISGVFPQIAFDYSSVELIFDAPKILSVDQWGDNQWGSMRKAFRGCENLVINASDLPDLSQVTDMSYMFNGARIFNQDIADWDVSTVTNMSYIFSSATIFNQDISNWDVSSVTNMMWMFQTAKAFNQDIGNWDVSSVINMERMFGGIGGADAFNQDISNWDVSSVITMERMFERADGFNQDISNWDLSSIVDMSFMFYSATAFNQDLRNLDVSSVTNMRSMFDGATAFDQDLGAWNVSSVTEMSNIFRDVELSTASYDSLLLGWSAQSLQNNVVFSGGNSTYSSTSQSARDVLTESFSWTVTDGGVAP